jgi:F-type H+-transporting ATPase subunit delta
MTSSSRQVFSGLRARLDRRRVAAEFADVSGELFAVADLLGKEPQLRSALSDAGQPVAARTGMVDSIFSERISPTGLDILKDVAGQRWPGSAQLVEALEGLAAQSAFMVAETNGALDGVEGELFAFSQAVSGSAELQMALTDPSVGPAEKAGLVDTLLAGRAAPQTCEVLRYAMSHLRGRRVDSVLDGLMDLAGEQRGRSIAEVRVARPLDADQAQRLASALSRINGRDVRLNVVVAPDVVGGISVRIGSEVIDATVASRMEQARRALAG